MPEATRKQKLFRKLFGFREGDIVRYEWPASGISALGRVVRRVDVCDGVLYCVAVDFKPNYVWFWEDEIELYEMTREEAIEKS